MRAATPWTVPTLLAACLLASFAFAGCASGPATFTIVLRGNEFLVNQGGQLVQGNLDGVHQGDTIVFRNDDDHLHQIAIHDTTFDEQVVPGSSVSYVIHDAPDAYHTQCSLHPSMQMYITVVA